MRYLVVITVGAALAVAAATPTAHPVLDKPVGHAHAGKGAR